MTARQIQERMNALITEAELLGVQLATHANEPDAPHMGTALHWVQSSVLTLKGARHDVTRHIQTTRTT